MPLRTTTPIPIKMPAPATPLGGPDPPGAGGMNFDTAPAQPNNPLQISPVLQKESQWCWAACVEMVTAFLSNPQQQCQAVTNLLTAGNPCSNSHDFREIGCSILKMAEVWKSVGVNSKLIRATDDEDLPALEFDKLKTEINANRPIEVGISWHGGRGGHAMIVKGYGKIGGLDSVWINDPLGATSKFGSNVKGGEGQILFKDLMEAHGYGAWVCSWMLAQPQG